MGPNDRPGAKTTSRGPTSAPSQPTKLRGVLLFFLLVLLVGGEGGMSRAGGKSSSWCRIISVISLWICGVAEGQTETGRWVSWVLWVLGIFRPRKDRSFLVVVNVTFFYIR